MLIELLDLSLAFPFSGLHNYLYELIRITPFYSFRFSPAFTVRERNDSRETDVVEPQRIATENVLTLTHPPSFGGILGLYQ